MTLSVTSVLLQLSGIALNAYMVRQIGASGMGLFSLMTSAYAVFITLACSGFGTAAVRLVAKALANGDEACARAAIHKPLAFSAITGTAACMGMILFSEDIAAAWVGNALTAGSFRIMAFSLPVIAISSVLRGYFTAVRRVAWNAVTDIAEQIVRIALVVALLPGALPEGEERICAAIAQSVTFSNVFSTVFMLAAYLISRKGRAVQGIAPIKTRDVLHISLPVALTGMLRSGLSSASKLLVPSSLTRYGMTKEDALARYGTIHALVFPILQLPEMILLSCATLLVPEFALLREQKDPRGVQRALGTVLRATFLFSIGAIGVFSCFPGELTRLLYGNPSAGGFLAALAPLALLLYLDKVVDSVLMGLHQQVRSMLYNLLESALTVGLIMLVVPKFGLGGYMLVLFAGKAVNMALSLSRLIKITELSIHFFDWVLRPLIAMLLSVSLVLLLRRFTPWSEPLLAASLAGLYAAQILATKHAFS